MVFSSSTWWQCFVWAASQSPRWGSWPSEWAPTSWAAYSDAVPPPGSTRWGSNPAWRYTPWDVDRKWAVAVPCIPSIRSLWMDGYVWVSLVGVNASFTYDSRRIAWREPAPFQAPVARCDSSVVARQDNRHGASNPCQCGIPAHPTTARPTVASGTCAVSGPVWLEKIKWINPELTCSWHLLTCMGRFL